MKTHFATWAAFLEAVSQPPSSDISAPSSLRTGSTAREWTWTRTFDEAMRLARGGWADGLAKVDAEFRRLRAALPKGEEIAALFAESGDEPEVGLFLEGDPENMVEFIMRDRQRPVVKLVVSLSIASGVSVDVIFRRGAAVMAVVDAMEDAGVRVEVVVDFSSRSGVATFCTTIVVKTAESAMDRDRLVFALCHPSMLRRLLFRLNETQGVEEWIRRGAESYGRPENPEEEEGACVIPMMAYNDPQWASTAAALRACEKLMAQLSVQW